MLTFLADENFHGDITRGLLRRRPEMDIVRLQDVGLSGADDPAVLDYAALSGRIVLTHDVATLKDFAFERVLRGLPMPGVLEVRRSLAIGRAIEEILLVTDLTREGELEGQVLYLPL